MRILRFFVLVAVAAYPMTMIATGCGSSSSGDSSGASGAGAAAAAGTSGGGVAGMSGVGGSTAGSGGAGTGGATSSGGAGGMSESVDVTQNPCFTLASGSANAHNPCDGDLYFMTGTNVDLGAAAASGTPYCLPASGVPAQAASLADVPSDYSTCMWTGYVEGGNGLANTGFIVRDAAQLHHYRMHVTSNTLPTLVFEYAKID